MINPSKNVVKNTTLAHKKPNTTHLFLLIPHIKIPLFSISTAIICTLFLTTQTFALPEALLDFFDQNNIFYHDPSGSAEDCEIASGNYDGKPSAGLSALQSEFVDKNYPIALKLGQEYGIPWETVIAQGILESASGTSKFARERNNFFGINARDHNPDLAYRYSTPAEGWRGYFKNIVNTSVYKDNGAFNFPNDPYGYLNAIYKAGYASDPDYVSKNTALIKAIEKRGEERNWQLSRKNTTGSNQVSLSDTVTTFCNGLTNLNPMSQILSFISKNINQVALLLSHDKRGNSQPKDIYKTALMTTGVNKLGDSCSMAGQSCDAFVATTLRYSGADPDVPCCGAANMLAYFIANKDKYQEIPNLGNTSNLQPGDIRSKSSHVEIITQVPGSSAFKIASASHCERTADHGIGFYPDSAYRIFRLKKSTNNK